jgi:hypothetical protein
MKQNDIALIAVCIFLGGVISLLISNTVFKGASTKTSVEVVEKITTEFMQPPERYFNAESLNPTQQIRIGNGSNPIQFGQ